MRKTETALRKAKSRRSRHNGRINADKQHILDRGFSFQTNDGREYKATLTKYFVPNSLNEDEPFEGIKSRIVRV